MDTSSSGKRAAVEATGDLFTARLIPRRRLELGRNDGLKVFFASTQCGGRVRSDRR